jgi:hypothetical protein
VRKIGSGLACREQFHKKVYTALLLAKMAWDLEEKPVDRVLSRNQERKARLPSCTDEIVCTGLTNDHVWNRAN